MLSNPSISYRNSRPLKDYSATGRARQSSGGSPLRIKTGGSRSPVHDRVNSSYVPRRMNYHKLGPSLADKRQTYSSHNLDLPMGSSAKKPDPKENKPNWLSMRTGGQYSKFQDDTPEQDVEDYNQRKDKVNKAIEDDRKIIEDAKKTNAPIYNQVDHSADNEYMRYIQRQRQGQQQPSAAQPSQNNRPEERKDDYLTNRLRQDTQDYKYNPVSPQRPQDFLTPEKKDIKYDPVNRKGLSTQVNSYSKSRLPAMASDPNILSDYDIYKNMQEDPYLRYLQHSQKKYQHRFVDLPHEQNDQIQMPKLPGEFRKYEDYNKPEEENNPYLNTLGEEEALPDRFDRYRDQERAITDKLAQFKRQPCKDWIVTGPHDVDPENEQQLRLYKDMHYMDMINAIRADLKEEDETRTEVERDRTHLQRSALKSKQLLSNSNCPGCQLERQLGENTMASVMAQEAHTCIIRLLDRPAAAGQTVRSRGGISAISRGASQRSAMRTKNKQLQMSAVKAAPTSKKDVNFYRKVSKYDLDRLNVNWTELLRERQRQMKANQEVALEEQGAEEKEKKMTEAVQKMLKINELKNKKEQNLKESKQTAMKNQQAITELIKSVNEIQQKEAQRPFNASQSRISGQGSQRSGNQRQNRDASSFGRGSVERNPPGHGQILNVSLSPNQMVQHRPPQPDVSPGQPDQGSQPWFEGGQLTDVSEEIIDIYGNVHHRSNGGTSYISSQHAKSSRRDGGARRDSKENSLRMKPLPWNGGGGPQSTTPKQGSKWKQTIFKQMF